MCLRDPVRTGTFAAGLLQAVQHARRQFPSERIRVLYAGTGPFATLSLLCCPFLSPAEVGFTVLDVHQNSLDQVRCIYDALEYHSFIDDLVCADVTSWEHDGPPFHVAVAEVMQRALMKEPQVAVTGQICSMLHPKGLLVPQRIALELSLFDITAEFDPETGWKGPGQRMSLGTLFELTRDTSVHASGRNEIPLGTITAPTGKSFEDLQVLTHITTFDDIELAENASGLTTVHSARLRDELAEKHSLHVSYRLGKTPGLVFTDKSSF